MRLCLFDDSDVRYTPQSLDSGPLGGSQSSLCLLAMELARSGSEVVLAGRHFPPQGSWRGMEIRNLADCRRRKDCRTDVAVVLNNSIAPAELEAMFPRRPYVVYWHKNSTLSPSSETFSRAQVTDRIDRFVFATHWNANQFICRFGLDYAKVAVIQNPVAPPFLDLFPDAASILPDKDPDLLVFASAPNRGLNRALAVLAAMRKSRPGLRLKVFCGFSLDQGELYTPAQRSKLEALLAECAATQGVELCRGARKSELAQALRGAALLCYPTLFVETSCIAALEAIAAGCLVSATAIGALPESTAGFARLTPFDRSGLSLEAFASNTLAALDERDRDAAAVEQRLRRAAERIRRCHAPQVVAAAWRRLLTDAASGGIGHGR